MDKAKWEEEIMTEIFPKYWKKITQILNTPLTLKREKSEEKYTDTHLSKMAENRKKAKEYLKNGLKRKTHYLQRRNKEMDIWFCNRNDKSWKNNGPIFNYAKREANEQWPSSNSKPWKNILQKLIWNSVLWNQKWEESWLWNLA